LAACSLEGILTNGTLCGSERFLAIFEANMSSQSYSVAEASRELGVSIPTVKLVNAGAKIDRVTP
jgi:hypothetical protein